MKKIYVNDVSPNLFFLLYFAAKQNIQEPDWEVAADHDGENVDGAVLVPEFECPLNEEELAELNSLVHQTDPNTPLTDLYVICREYVAGRCNLQSFQWNPWL